MPREQNSLNNLLFDPTVSRRKDSSPVREKNANDLQSNSSTLTGSFRFDPPGAPLKSTQQLNLDFSRFENHTFFGSAQAKVQKAFGKIINSYPFDGTKPEIDQFIDELTGFEKYVFDSIPHSLGYLVFSGSTGPTSVGSYISVKDFQGTYSPTLSKSPTGKSILNFGTGPFTTEFFINVPSGSVNENSVILQKISGTNGLTIALSSSYTTASPSGDAPLLAILSSGSLSLTASMTVPKGSFQHCAFVLDRSAGAGQLKLYKNGVLNATSSFGAFGQIDFITSPLTIASGTNASAGSYTFVVSSTLSGAIDELRFWHKTRNQKEIYEGQFQNAFAQNGLVLAYRFNEPSGSYASSAGSLVLDHSGNGLHANVSNFDISQRSSSSFGAPPLASENLKYSPVLFPSFSDLTNFNSILLTSSSDYDYNNPNLVTKLIPRHYLLESQQAEGYATEEGDVSNEIVTTSDQPGGAKIGQAQIISSLLYTMSDTFDELKCFVDEFKRLLKVDYVTKDTISDQLMPWLGRYYGIKLENMYSAASISQINGGENVTLGRGVTEPLQLIQNALWRRMLSDLPKTFANRGTMESLKSALRNFGINSDGPVRIRELGGAKSYFVGDSYLKRHEIASMLDFSGSFAGSATSPNAQGFYSTLPFVTSSFLSGSRVEPGAPFVKGSASDGLFTSGSWTFEGTYKFLESLDHPTPQSLVRLMTTGSTSPSNAGTVLFNLVANSEDLDNSITGSLQLYGRIVTGSNVPAFTLQLTGVNVFDGDKWQVSFGRNRGDLIDSTYLTSSYFLRASKFTVGGLENFISTSSFIDELGGSDVSENLLQNVTSSHNASGSFLVIGNQSITVGSAGLNDSSVSSVARTTQFTGKVSGLRFWSKGLTEKESKMHARNFKSLGVEDPDINFNFVTNASGSFERLRLDVSTDQPVTMSNSSGNITLFDFSQNGLTFGGSSFGNSGQVIKPERFDFETLSPDFKSENPNKIRVRSYLDDTLAETYGAQLAPLHRLPQNEQPKDDKRIQIEISAVQALNEDIMNIFATLDYLDNGIGSPELVFAQDYPALRHLRRVYFNRLTEKVNFVQVFQFFKWFDETIGDYLTQILPYDSKFMGSSFVVEPHALERPKFIYNYYDLYLGEENRGGKELILVQQIVGNVRKF
jgi:hypothetical protein